MTYPYRYAWRANGKYKNLFRQRCRVLARGALNSALVEFRNGNREIVSRNALRIATPPRQKSCFRKYPNIQKVK